MNKPTAKELRTWAENTAEEFNRGPIMQRSYDYRVRRLLEGVESGAEEYGLSKYAVGVAFKHWANKKGNTATISIAAVERMLVAGVRQPTAAEKAPELLRMLEEVLGYPFIQDMAAVKGSDFASTYRRAKKLVGGLQ